MPHIHGYIDFTADVYVVCGDKVLIRKHDKYNLWCAVGGHIELDETPEQAALREVKEEVGLDVTLYRGNMEFTEDGDDQTELVPPLFLNIHDIKADGSHKHISFVYAAKSESDEIIPENETDEWKWFSRSELEADSDLRKSVQVYALKALEVVQGE